MSKEFERLDAGVKKLREMADDLDCRNLIRLGDRLQWIIRFSGEVSGMIDDCESYLKLEDAKKAATFLVESGFEFRSVVLDGIRFFINEKKEVVPYTEGES